MHAAMDAGGCGSIRARGSRCAQERPGLALAMNVLYLASFQEPSAFEYRRHRLFDSRRPRGRLFGRGKVAQVTPLPTRCQRLEGALEMRVPSEPPPQLLGKRKI